mgnify:CR=1 FL=1
MARRTGFHAVLHLLPSLSRGELLNVAFRVAGLTGPLIEAPQELLLQTKARMQQVLRDRPLAEWGEALAPFVAEAKWQGFRGDGSRCHRACRCSSRSPTPRAQIEPFEGMVAPLGWSRP